MIYIAICDDEPYMLEELKEKIKQIFIQKKIEIDICCFSDGRSLLDCGRKWDIVFLDIQMDTINGLETAKALRESGFLGFLIFITVLKECVFDSFEVGAYDFLVKPLADDRFVRVMERLTASMQKDRNRFLFVQKNNECRMIPFDDILYCEVIDRKIYIHTIRQEVIDYYDKIDSLEKSLKENFFRCHRSYLINLQFVQGYKSGMACLREGKEIPVSRLRSKAFLDAMLLHMKR